MNLIDTIKSKISKKSNEHSKVDWKVVLSDNEITTIDFQLKENRVRIVDVETVEIEVYEAGPWGCEFWWRIIGEGSVVLIPNGAEGETDLVEEVKRWGGFNISEYEKATNDPENESYLVWSKY
tara:strand:- start:85 stop:453 length:369 start_codon:yes stop_codon:yes gene_type:complete